MNVVIRPEAPSDIAAIRHVNDVAFGGPDEALLVDALRDGGYLDVSLIAEMEGKVVGHIAFSPLQIVTESRSIHALSLAPMAVLPEFQRQGIGTKLITAGLQTCTDRGEVIVLVLGHPTYYPRFGFRTDASQSLQSPFGGGDAWMALELAPGSLNGVAGHVEFAPPFGAFEA